MQKISKFGIWQFLVMVGLSLFITSEPAMAAKVAAPVVDAYVGQDFVTFRASGNVITETNYGTVPGILGTQNRVVYTAQANTTIINDVSVLRTIRTVNGQRMIDLNLVIHENFLVSPNQYRSQILIKKCNKDDCATGVVSQPIVLPQNYYPHYSRSKIDSQGNIYIFESNFFYTPGVAMAFLTKINSQTLNVVFSMAINPPSAAQFPYKVMGTIDMAIDSLHNKAMLAFSLPYYSLGWIGDIHYVEISQIDTNNPVISNSVQVTTSNDIQTEVLIFIATNEATQDIVISYFKHYPSFQTEFIKYSFTAGTWVIQPYVFPNSSVFNMYSEGDHMVVYRYDGIYHNNSVELSLNLGTSFTNLTTLPNLGGQLFGPPQDDVKNLNGTVLPTLLRLGVPGGPNAQGQLLVHNGSSYVARNVAASINIPWHSAVVPYER